MQLLQYFDVFRCVSVSLNLEFLEPLEQKEYNYFFFIELLLAELR